MSKHHVQMIYCPVGSQEDAEKLAEGAVSRGLCACANIIGGMTSVYTWDGRLQKDQEVVCIFKTMNARLNELTDYISDNHSYETPAIVTIAVSETNSAFADWCIEQTKKP